jgi:hypothetical protein
VTAPAFGIGTNAWQSLPPIDTGYGPCVNGCAAFALGQVINTSSSGNGLNPLPNGSVTVIYTGSSANVSGFGGYDRGTGPFYEYGGNSYRPGEEQVYWGFIRDGVNFGPVPPGCGGAPSGDNDQPGYAIDLVGLKTVWTNTPFVIQLITSSDSAFSMTNAFVIDASVSSTQSVTYNNFAPIRDQHNALMPRGIGGGLSTVSGSLNTDHVKIIGNRASHGADFNNASTIAGFIITDKPVVTMSPQPIAVVTHDTVVLRALAAGVPPLSYQWRSGGAPISGATTASYGITNITTGGSYDLVVTNLYGSTTSKVSVVSIDRISITPGPDAGTNTITWKVADAVLQSSDALAGPYVDVSPTPVSPYPAPLEGTTKFYRYRNTPMTRLSNPYDM